MESEPDLSGRTRRDMRVVWPSVGETSRNARAMFLAVAVVVVGGALLDLVVARGLLDLFG